MRWLRAALVVGLLLVTLGCSLLDLFEPAPPPAPQVLVDPTVTPSQVPPTETVTPVAPPTADPCPVLRDVALPERTTDLDAYGDALQAYLHQGGDPDRLLLEPQEGLLRGDLTGDGVPEVVVGMIDVESLQVPPASRMLVLTCEGGGIERLYQYDPGEWYGLELIAIDDLTDDGAADLVFSDISCGAHTCWHTPYVWSWTGGDFANAITAAYRYPYPVFEVRDDALIVVSEGIGSVGAGPQRPITTTLSWSGDAITATDEIVGPPAYRYHALVDGDNAFAGGEFDAAVALYQRVLDDKMLTAWGGWSPPEEEHQWLRALAQWRLMVLSAYQGLEADAEAYYGALTSASEPGTPGYPVSVLAERYWRSYQRDGDAADACTYAVETDEVIEVITFLNGFGYANPWYEAPDICPYHGVSRR